MLLWEDFVTFDLMLKSVRRVIETMVKSAPFGILTCSLHFVLYFSSGPLLNSVQRKSCPVAQG